jgi:polysaccharide deacetylase family protein (PEP-CTERM system associated)
MTVNVFTVDWEDWYQGLELPPEDWSGFESRIHVGSYRLLELLGETGARATFFILGWNFSKTKSLVREIHSAGHEIGTHGYDHQFIYNKSREAYKEEMERAVKELEDAIGDKVLSHRAPFFSITKQSLWALEVLTELGIRFDSSIFPVLNYRYGISESPRFPYRILLPGGGEILEFPISTVEYPGVVLPCTGGAYFRIYPFLVSRAHMRRLNRRGHAVNFYIHPWELDPEQPRIDLPKRIALPHYVGLKRAEKRLALLLRCFQFGTLHEVMNHAEYDRFPSQSLL